MWVAQHRCGVRREDEVCALAAFIIPFFGEHEVSSRYLRETIVGLQAQTDANWLAVIVDDASPDERCRKLLAEIEEAYSPRISVLRQSENRGQGICRNRGIEWAARRECPFVLFNDADDISHPDRLSVVRDLFEQEPTVDLIYSTFRVIDEQGLPVRREEVSSPAIVDMLEVLGSNPVEGYDAWITIGTVTGFVCLPSATAVRTAIALQCPFPDERVAEDSYTWMQIAARGKEFRYIPTIPSQYRLPRHIDGSSHRSRIGKAKFNENEARVDTAAFINALAIAVERGRITEDRGEVLKDKFFRRLAAAMLREGESGLAARIWDAHLCKREMR